jgi:D,D-heptose 1,7-bisphosphate phosphatase
MNKAIFLDRDGTLIKEKNYLHQPKEIRLEKNVIPALKLLQKFNYLLIIITNQSGIGRGFFSLDQFIAVQNALLHRLKTYHITITDYFYCPHTPEAHCHCRKPQPGLLLDAIKKYQISPSSSFLIGDKLSDIEAGLNAHIKSILVSTGYGKNEQQNMSSLKINYVATDLLDAVHNYILKN